MAKVRITLVKSTNKAREKQVATVRALGLRKIGQTKKNKFNDDIKYLLA